MAAQVAGPGTALASYGSRWSRSRRASTARGEETSIASRLIVQGIKNVAEGTNAARRRSVPTGRTIRRRTVSFCLRFDHHARPSFLHDPKALTA